MNSSLFVNTHPQSSLFYFMLVFVHLFGGKICAQQVQASPDTLYANENMQVALFFPAPIQQAITGAPRMSFTYNKDHPQKLGLLKAQPGEPSNLLVVDKDNNIYSFVLEYRKELSVLKYRFFERDAIFKLKATPSDREVAGHHFFDYNANKTYVESFATYLFQRNLSVLKRKRHQKIKILMYQIQFYKEYAYLIMELTNNSSVSFLPGEISASLQLKKQGKKHTMQRQDLGIMHRLNIPDIVKPGESKRFMIILPKFTIPKKWMLDISLKEKKGRRHLQVTSNKL